MAEKIEFQAGDRVKAPGTEASGKVVGITGGWVHLEYANGARGVYEPERLTKVEAPAPAAPPVAEKKK